MIKLLLLSVDKLPACPHGDSKSEELPLRELGSVLSSIYFLVWMSDDGTGPEKIAHIMGPPDRCEHAARIINDLLQSLRSGPPGPPGAPGMPPGGRGRGRGQGNWGPPGGEMTFSIPTHKCGLVIGRGESLRLCPFPAWLCLHLPAFH